jgi:hypothetical protein
VALLAGFHDLGDRALTEQESSLLRGQPGYSATDDIREIDAELFKRLTGLPEQRRFSTLLDQATLLAQRLSWDVGRTQYLIDLLTRTRQLIFLWATWNRENIRGARARSKLDGRRF